MQQCLCGAPTYLVLAVKQSTCCAGGSSGWQAPEQLVARSGGDARQTRAVDIFSLGLVLFYCLTGGGHPFGESYERDSNILQVGPCLQQVSGCETAQQSPAQLFCACLRSSKPPSA